VGSLTGRDIEHVSMILIWGDMTPFSGDKCLKQPDSRAVNIASDESYSEALVLGHGLQLDDKSVSFPLHGLDSGYPSMNEKSQSYLVTSRSPVIVLGDVMRHILHRA
jgi:hypothetical protein